MRHRISGKKLNRSSGHRKALAKNLTYALFTHGRIKTTKTKAEFVRPYAERLITVAKRGLAKAEAQGDEAVAVGAQRRGRARPHRVPRARWGAPRG